ncbi:unnamed protein product [Chrysoparadoxa australica]
MHSMRALRGALRVNARRGASFRQVQRSKSAAPAAAQAFCFQCEQTQDGTGCLTSDSPGVCGKTPEVASLQDLFIRQLQDISAYAWRARLQSNAKSAAVDNFVFEGVFSTLTNVNFDPAAFMDYLEAGEAVKEDAKALYLKSCADSGSSPEEIATLPLTHALGSREDLEAMGRCVGVLARKDAIGNDDLHSLGELCLYGLKGTMAYATHARIMAKESEELYCSTHEALSTLADIKTKSAEEMLGLALKIGQMNLTAMELLDAGHTERYGHPTPCEARTSAIAGKCLLVSGHDLADLEEVLKRTEGKGINVYTHGELLPANGYPGLKKYPHLIGNWGGPWQQLQKMEFSRFPGPILMTSNCLVEPQKRYRDRIFTRSFVGWEGIPNLQTWDQFDQVIDKAMAMDGFKKDEPLQTVPVGFARDAVLGLADTVVGAVKSGDIGHFYLIGGCDGAEGDRSYFRDLALNVPDNAVVMTLGCGKYRFNKEKFAPTAAGIPRLLDVGQCNDAYSAIQIASALAKAFNTDVNGLPLTFAISWFEQQKAVAVLLTLLSLDVKNIHLGPALPAFVTPNVLQILVDTYGIKPTSNDDYKKDLA